MTAKSNNNSPESSWKLHTEAVEEEEEAGVAVVVRRGQPEEEAGQLGRIRQLKLLKGPSIEHRWLVAEEVVVAE